MRVAEKRSMTDARIAARSSSPTRSTRNASWVDVVAEEAVDAVADDLVEPADAAGEDRRAAGERLDRDEPERLRPRARHQDGVALRRTARRGRRRTARRGTRPRCRRAFRAGSKTVSL